MRTQEQNKNLAKLARYLLTLPKDYENFKMNVYNTSGIDHIRRGLPPECGTAACAVGHGPAAGIPIPVEFVIASDVIPTWIRWYSYVERYFTEDEEEFEWMFGSDWCTTDNTARGAAIRIVVLLEHGMDEPNRLTELNEQEGYSWQGSYRTLLDVTDLSILDSPEYQ